MAYRPDKGLQNRVQNTVKPLTCKCGCQWLQKIEVSRYDSTVATILGQPVPALDESPFIIYKCVACGKVVEQSLQYLGVDLNRQHHTDIIRLINKQNEVQCEGSQHSKIYPEAN